MSLSDITRRIKAMKLRHIEPPNKKKDKYQLTGGVERPKLEMRDGYRNKTQFLDDLNLIWRNCLVYNSDPVSSTRSCLFSLLRL
jgi:hypothetical protein